MTWDKSIPRRPMTRWLGLLAMVAHCSSCAILTPPRQTSTFPSDWSHFADRHIAGGDFQTVLTTTRRALTEQPQNAEALAAQGWALRRLGRLAQSRAATFQALALDANQPVALFNRAELQPHEPERLSWLNQAIRANPNCVSFRLTRGLALAGANDQGNASLDFNAAVQLAKDRPATWLFRSRWRAQRGLWALAEADAEQAIRLSPNAPEPWLARATIRTSQERWVGAVSDANNSIALAPDRPDGWATRGVIRLRTERFTDALTDLSHAITLAPDAADSLTHRGRTREFLGDTDGAREDYRRACDLGEPFGCLNLKRLTPPQLE